MDNLYESISFLCQALGGCAIALTVCFIFSLIIILLIYAYRDDTKTLIRKTLKEYKDEQSKHTN